jgi:hypothetical protein
MVPNFVWSCLTEARRGVPMFPLAIAMTVETGMMLLNMDSFQLAVVNGILEHFPYWNQVDAFG